jgi:hypothetical protein
MRATEQCTVEVTYARDRTVHCGGHICARQNSALWRSHMRATEQCTVEVTYVRDRTVHCGGHMRATEQCTVEVTYARQRTASTPFAQKLVQGHARPMCRHAVMWAALKQQYTPQSACCHCYSDCCSRVLHLLRRSRAGAERRATPSVPRASALSSQLSTMAVRDS